MNSFSIELQTPKLVAFNSLFFDHEYTQNALARIMQFHHVSWSSRSPDIFVFYGESGCGKTTLLKRYADKWNSANVSSENEVGVLYVLVPSQCTPRALAEAILTAIGDPAASKGTLSNMTSRVSHYAQEKQISMIVLDEFQHFMEKRSRRVVYTATNWLKTLTENVGCPFVAAGLPETTEVIAQNEQLERRVVGAIEMPSFPFHSKSDKKKFLTLIALFASKLPFENPEFLTKASVPSALHRATGGIIGRLARLIRIAGEQAVRSGSDRLEYCHLKSAYAELRAILPESFRGKPDPFDTEEGAQRVSGLTRHLSKSAQVLP